MNEHYDALGIEPGFDGDLRARRNALVKRHSETGEAPDEERMKAINRAYEALRGRQGRRIFRGRIARPGSAAMVVGGRPFVVHTVPRRDPAALAAPVLFGGLAVFAFGWAGAALAGLVWALLKYQRVHHHRRGL